MLLEEADFLNNESMSPLQVAKNNLHESCIKAIENYLMKRTILESKQLITANVLKQAQTSDPKEYA